MNMIDMLCCSRDVKSDNSSLEDRLLDVLLYGRKYDHVACLSFMPWRGVTSDGISD